MITIEIRDADKVNEGLAEIEIFCDLEGLSLLAKQLEHLKSGSSHVHLMTPAWAGDELSEKAVGNGTTLINHLRISLLSGHPHS
jgi:hypothetical protein